MFLPQQQITTIERKARIWPTIAKTVITLPDAPAGGQTVSPMMLITGIFSLVGMGIYAFFLSTMTGEGLLLLGIMAISGLMMLGTLLSFFLQWLPARRRQRRLLARYTRQLAECQRQARLLARQECQSWQELDPPLFLSGAQKSSPNDEPIAIVPIMQRSFNNQDVYLWARRPDDPDFLTVRLGMGDRPPRFTIKRGSIPQVSSQALAGVVDGADALLDTYASLLAPTKVPFDQYSSISVFGTERRLSQARRLACILLCHLIYHHSPEDVRIVVLAPVSQKTSWDWLLPLPHTLMYDSRQANEEGEQTHAVAIGSDAILQQLSLISREVGRRELLLADAPRERQDKARPVLPRLVIVVDHFDSEDDLDPPTMLLPVPLMPSRQARPLAASRSRLTTSPLRRAEMTLALNSGAFFGVCVLSICGERGAIPPSTGLLIDLNDALSVEDALAVPTLPTTLTPPVVPTTPLPGTVQARIQLLQPDAPPPTICRWIDEVSPDVLSRFSTRMQHLRPVVARRLELRTQVDLCMLFDPALDPATYTPHNYWHDPTFRSNTGEPLMRIPIGLKIGDETQYLDLIKDGPHGLLIGQTGSGKSELLQTMLMALAITYRPTEVNFLLIDYKAGLALEPFSQLPHTTAFLSNVSSRALIERFIVMLRAEATRRELRLREGGTLPRLVIVIDEFAEMVKNASFVLDELFTITRVGREIGMHLLLSAQRPEGIISSKVRDYVQYRLCLRCASPEDSRDVLRRVDAAALPASIPGRCYLLHGDNQLDLFQVARVTMPTIPTGSGLTGSGITPRLLSLQRESTSRPGSLAQL